MTTATLDAQAATPSRFIFSTIGRKIVMAVTGLVLVGFVVGHMAGNLQMFLGPVAMHDYAVLLRSLLHGTGVWIARGGLLIAVGLHIWAATSLTLENRSARPVRYRTWQPNASTLASRTMRWSGYLLLAYIIYHLLHMTFGTVHPDFWELEPYHNLVSAFQSKVVAFAYIGAMILLGFHLDHGIWSMLRTLGLSHPRYVKLVRSAAAGLSILVVIGYVSIPVAVLMGVLQ
jgi:succinate dehydrogenase / fumarate reductase cytochrome b subunit